MQAKLIKIKQKDYLWDGLVTLAYFLKNNGVMEIRVIILCISHIEI